MCPGQNTKESVSTWLRQQPRFRFGVHTAPRTQGFRYQCGWISVHDMDPSRQEMDSAAKNMILHVKSLVRCAKESMSALGRKDAERYVDMQEKWRTAAYVLE